MSDLPPMFQDGFRTLFVPLLHQFTGTLGPWESPTGHKIRSLFGTTFIDYPSQMSDELFIIVTKLVSILFYTSSCSDSLLQADDRLANWRNAFSTMAMTTLQTIFEQQQYDTPEKRAKYAQFMLGNDDKTPPYYYQVVPEKGKPCISSFLTRQCLLNVLLAGYFPV
jgi:hypothetical protein